MVAPGSPGLASVIDEFGTGVLSDDGSLNRSALAAIVFADADALDRLNAITHPLIRARAAQLVEQAPADAVVVYDVPLLAESAGRKDWDLVVVVDAPDEIRISRLIDRGVAEVEARARMAHQASRSERLAMADIVIDNSGSRQDLVGAVQDLWERLQH